MRRCARWLMLTGILFLAACSETGTGGFGSGSSFGTDPAGAVGDPTSPAYFQSAIGDRVFFEIDQSSLTEAGRVV
ncbi:MAG: peptidoglycan-associated lipoprotein, partial [Paracoccaceae bacterium]